MTTPGAPHGVKAGLFVFLRFNPNNVSFDGHHTVTLASHFIFAFPIDNFLHNSRLWKGQIRKPRARKYEMIWPVQRSGLFEGFRNMDDYTIFAINGLPLYFIYLTWNSSKCVRLVANVHFQYSGTTLVFGYVSCVGGPPFPPPFFGVVQFFNRLTSYPSLFFVSTPLGSVSFYRDSVSYQVISTFEPHSWGHWHAPLPVPSFLPSHWHTLFFHLLYRPCPLLSFFRIRLFKFFRVSNDQSVHPTLWVRTLLFISC